MFWEMVPGLLMNKEKPCMARNAPEGTRLSLTAGANYSCWNGPIKEFPTAAHRSSNGRKIQLTDCYMQMQCISWCNCRALELNLSQYIKKIEHVHGLLYTSSIRLGGRNVIFNLNIFCCNYNERMKMFRFVYFQKFDVQSKVELAVFLIRLLANVSWIL